MSRGRRIIRKESLRLSPEQHTVLRDFHQYMQTKIIDSQEQTQQRNGTLDTLDTEALLMHALSIWIVETEYPLLCALTYIQTCTPLYAFFDVSHVKRGRKSIF